MVMNVPLENLKEKRQIIMEKIYVVAKSQHQLDSTINHILLQAGR